MRLVPERIDKAWIETLADADLIDVEARLRAKFDLLDAREKKAQGNRYNLMRGPEDLVLAWDRWSRICRAMQGRTLLARRAKPGSKEAIPA
jgi:hypothetical protein